MPTLAAYRHALSDQEDLGGYLPITSTSASVSTTMTQEVISTTLMNDTNFVSTSYAGTWLLGVSGGTSIARLGEQRIVRKLGFDGATGTLIVTRPFGGTPPTAHNWELYYRIPAIRDEHGNAGYREIINTALARMAITGIITLTATDDTVRYHLNLSTYPWLRESGRILGLYATPADSGVRRLVDNRYWTLRLNNEIAEFEVNYSYAAGDTFDLEVYRPANSRLSLDGTWSDQSGSFAGLVDDADEAIPDEQAVAAVGMEIAYLQLAKDGPEAETRLWQQKAEIASRTASLYKFSKAKNTRDPLSPLLVGGNMNYEVWR